MEYPTKIVKPPSINTFIDLDCIKNDKAMRYNKNAENILVHLIYNISEGFFF